MSTLGFLKLTTRSQICHIHFLVDQRHHQGNLLHRAFDRVANHSLSKSVGQQKRDYSSNIRSKPKIQILSDLHLETPIAYDDYTITPSAPHLALLGDIGYAAHNGLFGFLEAQLQRFRTVMLLMGNHEPYGWTWEAARAKFREFESKSAKRRLSQPQSRYGDFVFLDRRRYDISDEVTILGCTLFSQIRPDQEDRVWYGLNDFHRIQDWTVQHHRDQHAVDVNWLNEQVTTLAKTEPQRKVMILSHHSPTADSRSIKPRHLQSPMSSGFMTDLADQPCWRMPCVRLWAFGHSHFNCDFVDEQTGRRLVTNQRGYQQSLAKGFDGTKYVEVD